jgi:hypothetical protein
VGEVGTPGAPTNRIRTMGVILFLWDQEEKYLRRVRDGIEIVHSIPL